MYSDNWVDFFRQDTSNSNQQRKMTTGKAVCAFVTNNQNQILAVSRKDDPTDFGLPGGKVDPGETAREAVVRELFEETGLSVVEVGNCLYEDDNTGHYCYTFEVEVEGVIDHNLEDGVVKWVDPQTLVRGSFGEYNRDLLAETDFLDR